MIVVIGGVQAAVRIDMSMPKAPDPKEVNRGGVSLWEREAYGEGGRFGSMQMMPSGDPSKDRISVHYSGCGYHVARLLAGKGWEVAFISVVGEDPLGLAAIAAAGPLGTLIPPSVPLIMYGIMAETSIAKLFMAGWLPGILLLIVLCLTIFIWAKTRPKDAPLTDKYPLKERFKSLIRVWPFLLLILVVMGGIWGGICTVNEGAAVGAVGATIITFAMRRLKVKEFVQTMKGVVGSGASFFFLFVGVQFFNSFMSLSGLPKALAKWVGSLNVAPMTVIWLMVVIYLFLGCFLDVAPLMMLTVPIFAPIVAGLGFNLVWFGIIVTFCGAIGCITPPVGMNLFVLANRVPDVKIGEIIRGILPFIAATFVALVICMYIPDISLLLPGLMR